MRSIPVIAGAAALAFALSTAAQSTDTTAQSGQDEGAMETEEQQPGIYSEGRGAMVKEGRQLDTNPMDEGAMDTEGLQPGTYSEDQEEADTEDQQPDIYSEGRGEMVTEGLQPGTFSEDQEAMDREQEMKDNPSSEE